MTEPHLSFTPRELTTPGGVSLPQQVQVHAKKKKETKDITKQITGDLKNASLYLRKELQKMQMSTGASIYLAGGLHTTGTEIESQEWRIASLETQIKDIEENLGKLPPGKQAIELRENLQQIIDQKTLLSTCLKQRKEFISKLQNHQPFLDAEKRSNQAASRILELHASGGDKDTKIRALRLHLDPILQKTYDNDPLTTHAKQLDRETAKLLVGAIKKYSKSAAANAETDLQKKFELLPPPSWKTLSLLPSGGEVEGAEAYLKRLSSEHPIDDTAKFHEKNLLSALTHSSIIDRTNKIEQVATKLLRVESHIEARLQEIYQGTLESRRSLPQQAAAYEHVLFKLEQELDKYKVEIAGLQGGRMRAEALGFVARWGAKIDDLRDRLVIMRSLEESKYQELIRAEKDLMKAFLKAHEEPGKAGQILYQAFLDIEEIEPPKEQKAAEFVNKSKTSLMKKLGEEAPALLSPSKEEQKRASEFLNDPAKIHKSPTFESYITKEMTKFVLKQGDPLNLARIFARLYTPGARGAEILAEMSTHDPNFKTLLKMTSNVRSRSNLALAKEYNVLADMIRDLPKVMSHDRDNEAYHYTEQRQKLADFAKKHPDAESFINEMKASLDAIRQHHGFMELSSEKVAKKKEILEKGIGGLIELSKDTGKPTKLKDNDDPRRLRLILSKTLVTAIHGDGSAKTKATDAMCELMKRLNHNEATAMRIAVFGGNRNMKSEAERTDDHADAARFTELVSDCVKTNPDAISGLREWLETGKWEAKLEDVVRDPWDAKRAAEIKGAEYPDKTKGAVLTERHFANSDDLALIQQLVLDRAELLGDKKDAKKIAKQEEIDEKIRELDGRLQVPVLRQLKRELICYSGEYHVNLNEETRIPGLLDRLRAMSPRPSEFSVLQGVADEYAVRPKDRKEEELDGDAKDIAMKVLNSCFTMTREVEALGAYFKTINDDNLLKKNFMSLVGTFNQSKEEFSSALTRALTPEAQAAHKEFRRDVDEVAAAGVAVAEQGKVAEEKRKKSLESITAEVEAIQKGNKQAVDALKALEQKKLAVQKQFTDEMTPLDQKKYLLASKGVEHEKRRVDISKGIDLGKADKAICKAASGEYFGTLIEMIQILQEAKRDKDVYSIRLDALLTGFMKQVFDGLPQQIVDLLKYTPKGPSRDELLQARQVLKSGLAKVGK